MITATEVATMTQAELDSLVSTFGHVPEDSEGTPIECLLAGWVNAKDVQDEEGLLSDEEFRRYALSEVLNMYRMEWSV